MSPPLDFGTATSASTESIISKCLVAAGINEDDTVYRERALVFLNFVYLNRLKGRHWKFTNRETFLDLTAPYETGTVALTQGSTSVTEDTAPPVIAFPTAVVGQTFAPQQTDQDVYRISARPSATSLTLASQYAGDSAAESTYKILFDRITLGDEILAIRSFVLSGIGEIKPVGLQEFRNRKASDPARVGQPDSFTLFEAEEGTGIWTLELYPAPDKRYSAQLEYSVRPTDLTDSATSFSLIPPEHMDVLYYGVLADIYRIQENAGMAQSAARDAANAWVRFSSDQEMTDSVARVQHSRRYFNRNQQRYRGFYGLRWFGRID